MSHKTWMERVKEIQKECKNREIPITLTFNPIEDEWVADLNGEQLGVPCEDFEAVLEELEGELNL